MDTSLSSWVLNKFASQIFSASWCSRTVSRWHVSGRQSKQRQGIHYFTEIFTWERLTLVGQISIYPQNNLRWVTESGAVQRRQQGQAASPQCSAPNPALLLQGATWSSPGAWDLGPPSPKHSPAATKRAPRSEAEPWPVFDFHPGEWNNYTDNHVIKAHLS